MSPTHRKWGIVQSIVAPLLVMAMIAVVLAVQLGRLQSRAVLVDHTDQMLSKAHEAQTRVMTQESALRGYLLTGDVAYRTRYERATADDLLTDLDALVVDADQHGRLASLRNRYTDWQTDVEATLASPRSDPVAAAGLDRRQARLDDLNADFALFVRHERELRAARAIASGQEVRHTVALSAALFVACVLLLAFFSRVQVRRVEEGHQRALEERRRDEELREVFLGILGHDLQSPLSAILLSAAMAGRRPGIDDTQRKALERVVSAGGRMSRMIGQLLDMTRARSGGGLRVERSLGSFGETCRRVVDEARAANPTREIDVVVEGDLRCLFDDDRMAQVLSNLIGNAVTHGVVDRPVLVAARRVAGEIELSVHNHGPAIPLDQRDAIFDPFRRGRGAARRSKQGLGLGLFIARQIVLAHGGDLSVVSDAVAGTTFSATFPAQTTTPATTRSDDAEAGAGQRICSKSACVRP